MNAPISKAAQGTILLFASLLLHDEATAATVSYNFDETGWVNTAGTSEDFFGSFTGTPDAEGNLALSAVSSFSATMTETNAQGETKAIARFGGPLGTSGLTDFLYELGSNSLNLAVSGIPTGMLCLGSTVAAGICGALPPRPVPKPGTPPLPPIDGVFNFSSLNSSLNAVTTNLPGVVQPVVPVPAPAPSPVPEPAYLGAFGLLLILVRIKLHRANDFARGFGCGNGVRKRFANG